MRNTNQMTFRSNRGFSLIELLIVVTLIGILSAIALPQMVTQRRLTRSSSLGREIMSQMRTARQRAMSDRQAVTFEYNNTTKQIRIISHNNNRIPDPAVPSPTDICFMPRAAILTAAGYPDTVCRTVASTYALNQGGLPIDEIDYGIPTGLPTVALGDTISMTPLTGVRLFITFQSDGSVINNLGVPQDSAFFFFNNKAAQTTATAISVVGASGRVKVWRYQPNATSYVE